MFDASIISMIATVVIAAYAWRSYELSRQIKIANELKTQTDQEFRQQVNDLYRAIVISNILSGQATHMDFESLIRDFKSKYKAKTPIFEEENNV